MRGTSFASANLESSVWALEGNFQRATSATGSATCSPTVRYRLSLSPPTDLSRLSPCPIGC
eukprot:3179091-Pyramimonas_sp.AAC.1